jgi:hypothetical protein
MGTSKTLWIYWQGRKETVFKGAQINPKTFTSNLSLAFDNTVTI